MEAGWLLCIPAYVTACCILDSATVIGANRWNQWHSAGGPQPAGTEAPGCSPTSAAIARCRRSRLGSIRKWSYCWNGLRFFFLLLGLSRARGCSLQSQAKPAFLHPGRKRAIYISVPRAPVNPNTPPRYERRSPRPPSCRHPRASPSWTSSPQVRSRWRAAVETAVANVNPLSPRRHRRCVRGKPPSQGPFRVDGC